MKNVDAITPELKEKYGQVYSLSISIEPDEDTRIDLAYRFKKPAVSSYDRYVKTVAKSPTKANRAFILDNVIEEDREKLLADLEEYPAIPLTAADKLLGLLGIGEANLQKL